MTYEFTFHGQRITARVPEGTFRTRISLGWTVERAKGPKVPPSAVGRRGGRKSRGNPLCQFAVVPRGM